MIFHTEPHIKFICTGIEFQRWTLEHTTNSFITKSLLTMQLLGVFILSNVVTVMAFVPNQATTTNKNIITSSTSSSRRTQLYNDLWGEPPNKDGQSKEMSKSLPFIARPKLLDGSLPGDVGFEYVFL